MPRPPPPGSALRSELNVGAVRMPLDSDLVVPAGSECDLLLPTYSQAAGRAEPVSITDVAGNSILQVHPAWERPKSNAVRLEFALPWMQLCTPSGHLMAKFAKVISDGNPRFSIFRPNFELFAQITAIDSGAPREWPDEYRLETVGGDLYRVFGCVKDSLMQITAPGGTLVATTEATPEGDCMMRAIALTDVGLVTCTFLSLMHLGQLGEGAASRPGRRSYGGPLLSARSYGQGSSSWGP